LEIFNISIGEPRIFELADVETELVKHYCEASNAQLDVCISWVDMVITGTFIADEEIGN